MRTKSLILLLILVMGARLAAQSDSAALSRAQKKQIYSSPRKASIMSAVLPGLGQIYNRKYWKVPVIYAGLGAGAYFFYVNNGYYNDYRRALREAAAVGGPGKATVDGVSYSTEDLKTQKIFYRKRRDFAGLGVGIFYLLNIIDANVDAHLRTFDVSDDLSLRLAPRLMFAPHIPLAPGINITLTYR